MSNRQIIAAAHRRAILHLQTLSLRRAFLDLLRRHTRKGICLKKFQRLHFWSARLARHVESTEHRSSSQTSYPGSSDVVSASSFPMKFPSSSHLLSFSLETPVISRVGKESFSDLHTWAIASKLIELPSHAKKNARHY